MLVIATSQNNNLARACIWNKSWEKYNRLCAFDVLLKPLDVVSVIYRVSNLGNTFLSIHLDIVQNHKVLPTSSVQKHLSQNSKPFEATMPLFHLWLCNKKQTKIHITRKL